MITIRVPILRGQTIPDILAGVKALYPDKVYFVGEVTHLWIGWEEGNAEDLYEALEDRFTMEAPEDAKTAPPYLRVELTYDDAYNIFAY